MEGGGLEEESEGEGGQPAVLYNRSRKTKVIVCGHHRRLTENADREKQTPRSCCVPPSEVPGPQSQRVCFFLTVRTARMKDRRRAKCVNAFFEVVSDLREGLGVSAHEWCDPYTNCKEDSREEMVLEWSGAMRLPLGKGVAKYAKAVHCITDHPATVFHALRYRDAQAAEKTCSHLANLELRYRTCADAGGAIALPVKTVHLLWEYLEEMSELSFQCERVEAPLVPTPAEIGENIESRKSSSGERTDAPILEGGSYETFCGIFVRRELTKPTTAEFQGKMQTFLAGSEREDLDNQGEAVARLLRSLFTELATVDLDGQDWSDLKRSVALLDMDRAIPTDMMRGIEAAAESLARDIGSGAMTMDSLNVEEIGQKVMATVSPSDARVFAANLGKILPAIQKMQ